MANRKIADLVFNGRKLLSVESIRRVVYNGKVIWPFTEGQNDPTIQRIVLNGEVLFDRNSIPYLNVEKEVVYVDQDPSIESINRIFTNTTFVVE
nr:MAG TPA: hypothetical protein [Caudoviricetes sp.]